jgi:ABC-type multidrug transport system ATPase subunit
MPNLTVRETLRFAADLKLDLPEAEREARVDALIGELKLEKCQHTRVGNQMMRGISGGEKRRTSIAYELITDPHVVLLDEPTSGLDSLTSFIVMKYLRKLAVVEGKTVALTIHNPNYEIFGLFDRLILLAEGLTVFQGRATDAIRYFEMTFGVACFDIQSPGEYLISLAHRLRFNQEKLELYADRYQKTLSTEVQKDISLHTVGPTPKRDCSVSYLTIYSVLIKREGVNMFKNPVLLATRFIQTVFIVIFAGGICCNIGNSDLTNKINWQAITGLFFFLGINGLNNSLNPTAMFFPMERNVFLK